MMRKDHNMHMASATGTSADSKNKPKSAAWFKPDAPFDKAADAQAREKLITARIGLLLRAPFFGNLATRLELVNADDWLPTLAVDGRRFYYNSHFVNLLSLREVEFGFGHEVLHCVYDHIGMDGRAGSRDPQLFNIAADYCVNADLLDARVGERITKVDILFDPKYKGWSAEEVYDDLMQNAQKINIQSLIDKLLDEHLKSQPGSGDGDDDGDDDGKKPKINPGELDAIRDEIKQAVLQAAQAAGAGNVPAGVKRLIKNLTEAKLDWRSLLQQQLESVFKNDFTWMKPSRKGWHQDAVMPGMTPGTQCDVVIAIDTSGSIGEEDIKDFLSEVKGIMEAYDSYKVTVWTFDTQVYNQQEFTSENMRDIIDYEPQGGGGTDFEVNWKYMKDNGIEPKKFVMFTDGYPYSSWGDPDYCDTVWVIKGNPNAQPPFGVWAVYEHADEGVKSR
ncbi:MAG: VWA-like domain-containing protein [Fischerella sp.]|nr:VWA-like domain-containing protein [Fischerella sp.]